MPHNKGMDWVRLPKRMAIYFRDGFDCVWCRGVFPIDTRGYGLTLDHLDGVSNDPKNLVTCCGPCNSARKELTQQQWYERLGERGFHVRSVKNRVKRQIRKPINLHAGKWLASLRRPNYNKPTVKPKILPLPILKQTASQRSA